MRVHRPISPCAPRNAEAGLALLRTVLCVGFLLVTVFLLVTRFARGRCGPLLSRTLSRRRLGLRRLSRRTSLRRLRRRRRWRSDLRWWRHPWLCGALWRGRCCGLWALASVAGLLALCTLVWRLRGWSLRSNLRSRGHFGRCSGQRRWRHCYGLSALAPLAGLLGFCALLRRSRRWCGWSNLWSRRRLGLGVTLRRWQRCDRLCWLTPLARLFGLSSLLR